MNMVSRVMLKSCPHDFQTFLSAALLTSPFPLHQQVSRLPRQIQQSACSLIFLFFHTAAVWPLSYHQTWQEQSIYQLFHSSLHLLANHPFRPGVSSSYPEIQQKDSTPPKTNKQKPPHISNTQSFFLNTDLSYDA